MPEQPPFNPLQRPTPQEPPKAPQPQESASTPPETPPIKSEEPQQEKRDFLQREEVRTMGKDILKVRKEETQKERERISNIGTPQKRVDSVPPKQPIAPGLIEPEEQEELAPPPSRGGDKTLIRTIIIGIVLIIIINVSALGYWFWRSAQQEDPVVITPPITTPPPVETQDPTPPPPEEQDPEPPVEQQQDPEPPVEPEPAQLLTPVFTPEQTADIEVASNQGILSKLTELLLTDQANGFTALSVKNTTSSTFLSGVDVLSALNLLVPTDVSDQFSEDSTVFIYSTDGKDRLGFVVKLKEEADIATALSLWEATLETNTAPLFALLEGKGTKYSQFWRSSQYQGTSFRFQTFSETDLGIVYTTLNNHLILMSSFESMEAAIDKLL